MIKGAGVSVSGVTWRKGGLVIIRDEEWWWGQKGAILAWHNYWTAPHLYICTILYVITECIIELNWLCKHIKKVRSSQPAIHSSQTNIIKAKILLDIFLSKYTCRQFSISILYAFRLSKDFQDTWKNYFIYRYFYQHWLVKISFSA